MKQTMVFHSRKTGANAAVLILKETTTDLTTTCGKKETLKGGVTKLLQTTAGDLKDVNLKEAIMRRSTRTGEKPGLKTFGSLSQIASQGRSEVLSPGTGPAVRREITAMAGEAL